MVMTDRPPQKPGNSGFCPDCGTPAWFYDGHRSCSVGCPRDQSGEAERIYDIELVREALREAMIWAPSEHDNEKPCLIRDALEAFERVVKAIP